MQIVTRCFSRDQRLLLNGHRARFGFFKRVAHRRHRTRIRQLTKALLRDEVDADEAVFDTKPITGWDVV